MPKYLIEASYTLDGIKGVQAGGGSAWREAVARLIASVGGRLETFSTENGVAARWAFDVNFKSGRSAQCEGIDSWVIGEDSKIHALDVYYDPTPLQQALAG